MKITDSDGWITVSIPREDAEELIEALVCGASLLSGEREYDMDDALARFAEGIRVAIESARKEDEDAQLA